MKHYYFSNTADLRGEHEIHTEGCAFIPPSSNRSYIGYYFDCSNAIRDARIQYPYKSFNGCYYCCRECHKR